MSNNAPNVLYAAVKREFASMNLPEAKAAIPDSYRMSTGTELEGLLVATLRDQQVMGFVKATGELDIYADSASCALGTTYYNLSLDTKGFIVANRDHSIFDNGYSRKQGARYFSPAEVVREYGSMTPKEFKGLLNKALRKKIAESRKTAEVLNHLFGYEVQPVEEIS